MIEDQNSTNGQNKRIAKNTLMLYIRMVLSMVITLYTSRVVLNVLGVEDFGIYNVVGGVVIALGFLNNAMTAATQRFLTYEIALNDLVATKKVFNMSILIHLLISILIFFVAETVGLWFINTQMVMPSERQVAAMWVYQFSVFSFIITVLSVPYNALLIAHEYMKSFAMIGMIEVFLKLGIVFLLLAYGGDKLVLYSLMLFIVAITIRVIYSVYCYRNFEESRNIRLEWDMNLFKRMGNFAGWNLLGVLAGISYNQGVNILLNVFFGPVINASRAIAFQVQGAVTSFVNNYQLAVNPSITKHYANRDEDKCFDLVFTSSKFSFFLLLILALPLLLETRQILIWWLRIVPEFTVIFTRLVLVDILIGSLSGSLQSLAQATGKIRKYQIVVSGILLLNLPVSYFLLKSGFTPEYTLLTSIFLSVVALVARILVLKAQIKFPAKNFTYQIIFRVAFVAVLASAFGFGAQHYLLYIHGQFLIVSTLSTIITLLLILFVGLNQAEKTLLKNNVTLLMAKIKK